MLPTGIFENFRSKVVTNQERYSEIITRIGSEMSQEERDILSKDVKDTYQFVVGCITRTVNLMNRYLTLEEKREFAELLPEILELKDDRLVLADAAKI